MEVEQADASHERRRVEGDGRRAEGGVWCPMHRDAMREFVRGNLLAEIQGRDRRQLKRYMSIATRRQQVQSLPCCPMWDQSNGTWPRGKSVSRPCCTFRDGLHSLLIRVTTVVDQGARDCSEARRVPMQARGNGARLSLALQICAGTS